MDHKRAIGALLTTPKAETQMLFFLTLIFCCQLAGELLVAASGLAIPGPVIGMLLLFVGLLVRGSVPEDLASVGDSLLTHLSLLFIPAGVGILLHARQLVDELLPITVSLILSTILTIAVTGVLMSRLGKQEPQQREHRDGGNAG